MLLGVRESLMTTALLGEALDASIATLINALGSAGIGFRDLHTTQSSLEDIFVSLVKERR